MTQHPTRVSISGARFQDTLRRHRAFWQRGTEGCLRSSAVVAPSAPLALPQRDGSFVTHANPVTPDQIDVGAMIDQFLAVNEADLDPTLTVKGIYLAMVGMGDQMPMTRALPKIPWIEAMLGCPITMTEGHIWNEHYRGDPEEVVRRGAHFEHNPWFQLYLEFLKQLQARLGDRFPCAANTLFRGASDLAAAVMGVQEACIAWIDQPAFMARLMRVCTDANLACIEAGYKVLKPFLGGYPCADAVWAPAQVLWTQCDHATLVSARMYERQILPFDLEIIRSKPMSVIHLHNSNLHVAPLLVQIPELSAIEVAVDPYPTGERKVWEVEMLRMIMQHKPLFLDVWFPNLDEAGWLAEQLPKRGVCFNARFEPADWAGAPADFPGRETWVLVP